MIIVRYKDPNCRASAGYYGKLCEPEYIGNIYSICAHCNWRELMDLETCKAETAEGARCKRAARTNLFCSHHQYEDEAKQARLWYERTKNITAAEINYAIDQLDHYVYVIAADGFVKIGHSVNPELRLKSLQSESDMTLRPNKVQQSNMKIIKTVKGGPNLEGLLHAMCRQSRVTGEWFKHDSFTAEIIERLDDTWVKKAQ
jgi:hypothetical protein